MIVDGSGNAISRVALAVALGAVAGNESLVPAIRTTDVTEMLSDSSTGLNIQRWVDLVFTMKALLISMTTSGVPSLRGLVAIVVEMSTIFGMPVPGFSSRPVTPRS